MILAKFLFNLLCILVLLIGLTIVIIGGFYVIKTILEEWFEIDVKSVIKRRENDNNSNDVERFRKRN